MAQDTRRSVMPIVTVDSVDPVRDFYVDKLGFTHQMGVVGKDGQLDFCLVGLDGATVMFSRTRDHSAGLAAADKKSVEMYVEVGDIDAYHTKVKKSGVTITDPLTLQWWGDKTFKVTDPAGYLVWFFQTVGEPKPPTGTKLV